MMLNDYVISNALLAEMDPVSLGIMGLICLMVLVFAIMAGKTWHWVNIVFLILTMIAGVAATFGMTQVYRQRTAELSDYQKAVERWENAQEQLQQATVGDSLSPTFGEDSLRYIEQEVSLDMVGRGRVWSGAVVPEGDQRKFTFSTPRNVANEREQLKDYVLYAFVDDNIRGQSYPTRYIGSVRVTEETNETATLEAVRVTDFNAFNGGGGNWTLFEKMPHDRHGIFRQAIVTEAESNPDAPEIFGTFAESLKQEEDTNQDQIRDISAFRAILKNKYLPAQKLGYDPQSQEYEALIDNYAFDGLPLGKIEKWIDANSDSRVMPRFEPLPEEKFYKYKFNSKSSKTYRVDTTGSLENDGIFSSTGKTVVPQFQHSGDVEFQEGDIILIDSLTAEGYQRSAESTAPPFTEGEDLEQIDTIYVRQLRDFPYEFSEMRNQIASIQAEIQRITEALKKQDKAIADALAQIAFRNNEIAQLEADQEKLERDLAEITQLRQQKDATVESNQQQIASLQSRVAEVYGKIREVSLEMARRAFTKPNPNP